MEDFETTLKYYLNDGGVLRLNNICINANIQTLRGGIEDRRLEKKKRKKLHDLKKNMIIIAILNIEIMVM